MSRRTLQHAGALVLLGVFVACSDNGSAPDAESLQVSTDVAVSSASSVMEDFGAVAGGGMGVGMAVDGHHMAGRVGGDCTYSAATGRFTCPTITRDGLTLTRSYALRDAQGVAQSAFDAQTTESVNSQTSLAGTITRDAFSATLDNQRDVTLSGLSGAETRHVWNASGSRDESSTYTGDRGTRAYTLVSTDVVTDVVRLLPAVEHPWPESGQVTHQIAVTQTRAGAQTVSRSFERRVTVTFNGTRFVPMTVGDVEFTLDLATGRVVRR
jgi:hypothetical protein